MVSYGGGNRSYSPSAPPAPDPQQPMLAHLYHPPPAQYPANPSMPYSPSTYPQSSTASFGSGPTPPPHGFSSYPTRISNRRTFTVRTHPDVVRSFQMVDRNQNGYIEEMELQQALAWDYQKFSLRT